MAKTSHPCRIEKRQDGWVLVIGLVVLVMLTIIAMALMRTTLLEEKMAGAMRESNLSFQAAESALRAAETYIEEEDEDTFKCTADCADGIYAESAPEPAPFDTETWANSLKYDDCLASVESQLPRYIIQKVSEIGGEGSLNIGGYGETDLTQTSVVYRITARGTAGGAPEAKTIVGCDSLDENTGSIRTILRSHYGKMY